MKRILFISYDGLTDSLGQSQIIPYLAGLTKYGYEFTILSCDKPKLFKKNEAYVLKILETFPIQWTSIPYHKNPPVISSIYDFYNLKNQARHLHLVQKFDMVHTRPGLPTLVALWLKKRYGIKFLNDIRGFWADERVDGGMWNLKNPVYNLIYKYFKKHEYDCIEKSDYNTCLTYNAKKEIQTWKVSGQPIPIEVIPCSVDLDLFNPENIDIILKNNLQNALNISDDDFIISYLGSIGGWYLTNEMMQFCKLISDKIPNAKFLFITPALQSTILNVAAKYVLPSEKIVVKYGQRHEVPVLLSFSRYSIFFIKKCYSKISSSPAKHGEIMAMGIPIITNSGVGDVDNIMMKYKAGLVLKDLNEIEFLKTSEQILSNMAFDSAEIRQGAKEYYSLEDALQKYLKVYKIILGT